MSDNASIDLAVVIVNWNTIGLLRDCLQSIYGNQSGLPLQVIVVDNASEDGSPAMVREQFPQVELIVNATNCGFAAANNQGFKLARGRHVLLLNSDTVILGDVLKRSVDYLDQHPDVGAMGCRVLNTDRSLQISSVAYPTVLNLFLLTSGLSRIAFLDRLDERDWQRQDERDVDVIPGCYLMVRRSTLDAVGGLDEQFFFFGEETDWCYRIRQAGWKLRFAPVGEIIHHHGGSVRRLNYVRDLMLSSAMVRLHRKHSGIFAAAVVWVLVVAFNTSRALFWGLASLVRRSDWILQRRAHFFNLVASSRRIWPRLGVPDDLGRSKAT